MAEPTIACPNCKTEIKLTGSLAAPLIGSARKLFEQQFQWQVNHGGLLTIPRSPA